LRFRPTAHFAGRLQFFRDRAAADIMRYAQGTPIVGYHDEEGNLVIPAEYDDEYKENRLSPARFHRKPHRPYDPFGR